MQSLMKLRKIFGKSRVGVLGSLVAYGMLTLHMTSRPVHGMFTDRSNLIPFSTRQLNYGVAVSDVDGDGEMEWIVAGFSGPNLVLKLNKATGYYYNLATEQDERFKALRDPEGQAIGVCACDIDGDGREEIYFLNTNDRYSGPKKYKDKLFKWRRGADGREGYENLFDDAGNDAALSMFAGRSVAAVDRKGSGKYSIILATYGEYGQGSFGLIEMDEKASNVASGRIVLRNVAQEAGIAMSTGGRGITVGPIVGRDGHSDIFFDNEGGFRGNDPRNALFVNDGRGHFTNKAEELGLSDTSPGRGVALADFNNDGRVDIVYGNWMDPHRLMLQRRDGTFQNVSSAEMAVPSPIRTVIAADFDNDGVLEVFYNNIVYQSRWGGSPPQTWENRLFRVAPSSSSSSSYSGDVSITKLDIGDALEPDGYGTGGAVADMDGDGRLELLLSHGESRAQDLSLYHVTSPTQNHWLRVLPLTRYNAPARGSKVTVTLSDDTQLTRVVDGGSGYLCQMEPVAHFGLGAQTVVGLTVQWPDGSVVTRQLSWEDQDKLHLVQFPPSSPSGGGGRGGNPPEEPQYRVRESFESGARTGGSSSSHSDLGDRRIGMNIPRRGLGAPGREIGAGAAYRRPSAVAPYRRPSAVAPNRGPSAVAPYSRPSAVAPNSRPSAVAPNRRPSAVALNREARAGAPNAEIPFKRGSAGAPNRGESAGAPYRRGSAGDPNRGASVGTPNKRVSAGAPYREGSAGAPSRGASAGAPNRGANAGIPFRRGSAGTPNSGSRAGVPNRRGSAGAPIRTGAGAPNRRTNPNRGGAQAPYRRPSSARPYRRNDRRTPYRRTSAPTPNRRSNVERPYRGARANVPSRESNSRVDSQWFSGGGAFNRQTTSTPGRRVPSVGKESISGLDTKRKSKMPRPDDSNEGSCKTERVRKYIRDDASGCYSARPIRMGQCQGTCTKGGHCCQPRQNQYRNILFSCRHGARYRKVSKAGVRRCRCVRCPA